LLHVQDGIFLSASDYHDVQIDGNGALELSGDVTVGGDWINNGGILTPNGHAVMFNGAGSQTLGGSSATSFHDLVINDGLLGYWKLDEGSGSTAADSSGYGHDGTLINTNFTSTTPAAIAFNNTHALEFDGANEYVDVTANPKD